jgi:hypothetical protein
MKRSPIPASLSGVSVLSAAYLLGSVATAYASLPACGSEPGISGGVRIGAVQF